MSRVTRVRALRAVRAVCGTPTHWQVKDLMAPANMTRPPMSIALIKDIEKAGGKPAAATTR